METWSPENQHIWTVREKVGQNVKNRETCLLEYFWLQVYTDNICNDVHVWFFSVFLFHLVFSAHCNAVAVLYGTSTAVILRLQMVLNAAARTVVGIGKYEHITPVLCDSLHWLPVAARIQCKTAALTFNCVRGTGPVYLKQIVCAVSNLSRRSIRSTGRGAVAAPGS